MEKTIVVIRVLVLLIGVIINVLINIQLKNILTKKIITSKTSTLLMDSNLFKLNVPSSAKYYATASTINKKINIVFILVQTALIIVLGIIYYFIFPSMKMFALIKIIFILGIMYLLSYEFKIIATNYKIIKNDRSLKLMTFVVTILLIGSISFGTFLIKDAPFNKKNIKNNTENKIITIPANEVESRLYIKSNSRYGTMKVYYCNENNQMESMNISLNEKIKFINDNSIANPYLTITKNYRSYCNLDSKELNQYEDSIQFTYTLSGNTDFITSFEQKINLAKNNID